MTPLAAGYQHFADGAPVRQLPADGTLPAFAEYLLVTVE